MELQPTKLAPREAQALADLLPMLICGEESAVLAFDGLAASATTQARSALAQVAEEERCHDALLSGIRAGLPEARNLAAALARANRFYLRLQERDPIRHLARITALDSAACMVIAALSRKGRGLSRDPDLVAKLHFIHRDEVRHVRLGLAMSAALGRERLTIQEETRAALSTLLEPYADTFEILGVDPDILFGSLRRISGTLRGC